MKLTFVSNDVKVNLTKINKEVKHNEKGESTEKTLVQGRYGIVPAVSANADLVRDLRISADVRYHYRV